MCVDDGVRRIQELVTDPVLNQSAAGQSGDPELENLAGQGEGDREGAVLDAELDAFVGALQTSGVKGEDAMRRVIVFVSEMAE